MFAPNFCRFKAIVVLVCIIALTTLTVAFDLAVAIAGQVLHVEGAGVVGELTKMEQNE